MAEQSTPLQNTRAIVMALLQEVKSVGLNHNLVLEGEDKVTVGYGVSVRMIRESAKELGL